MARRTTSPTQNDPYAPADGTDTGGGDITPTASSGQTGQVGQAPRPASSHTWDFGGTWTNGTFTPANNDWQAWFRQVMQGKPISQTTLKTLESSLKDYGIQLSPANASGQISKIGLPNGTWVRVLEGDPNAASLTWVPQSATGTGGGVDAGSLYNSPLTKPFGETFTAPPTLDLGGTHGLPYIPDAPSFQPPTFQAPSFDQALNDPGYQFARDQGLKGLEQGAAAQGTLGTFNTPYNLGTFATNFANQHYGDVFNRALQTYNTTYQGAYDAFQPLMAQWNTLSAAGTNQNGLNYQHAWDQFLNRQSDYNNWQDRAFNKVYNTSIA